MEPSSGETKEVYNPYVLHLLYVKMRYLRRILMRYYARLEEPSLMDRCITNDWCAATLTRDLVAIQRAMQKELYPMNLCFCHYEFYLFRLSQLFRVPGEGIDHLYGGRRYECETSLMKVMDQENYRWRIQALLRQYVETFYFQQGGRRTDFLFLVKQTMEKEVCETMIDQENMQFFIQYDNELTATLFFLHLAEELMCLHEKESAQVTHEPVINDFKFWSRKLFTTTPTTTTTSTHPIENTTTLMLHKMMVNLCYSFRAQVLDRTRYYAKETVATEETSVLPSWLMTLSTPSESEERGTAYEIRKYVRLLNSEYQLKKPLEDAVVMPKKKPIGRSEFYNSNRGSQLKALPVVYVVLDANLLEYTHFLYRVAFELNLQENHVRCVAATTTNKTCYLCEYNRRGQMVKLLRLCEEQVEDPETSIGRLTILNVALAKFHLDLVPSLTSCTYKTLANVFSLFECLPLPPSHKHQQHSLVGMINPIQLLNSLTTSVVVSKLEKKMCEVITLCSRKVGAAATNSDEIIEREQFLAMDVELVRLIIDAIVEQQHEINRYERATNQSLVMGDNTGLSKEVTAALHKIYVAHIDVLCQVMAERHGSICVLVDK